MEGTQGTAGSETASDGFPTSYTFVMYPFVIGTEKSRMLKPLEEAAEVFGAWQAASRSTDDESRSEIVYECFDTIQAAVNVLASLGVTQAEANRAIRQVSEHNAERGRYRSSNDPQS